MENTEFDLFEAHTPFLKDGFWEESYKSTLLNCLMSAYKPEVIRHWKAVDFSVHKDDKILIKWIRRSFPLSDAEIKEGKY